MQTNSQGLATGAKRPAPGDGGGGSEDGKGKNKKPRLISALPLFSHGVHGGSTGKAIDQLQLCLRRW